MPVRIVDNDFESVDYRDVVDRIDLRDVMAPGKAKHGNKPVLIRCLWHDEQEPSLAVYRTAAFCYGCNKRVSTLEWISLQEGLDIEKEFRQVVDVAHRRYAGGVSVAPRKIEKKELEAWEPMNPAHALFCHERLGKRRQWFRDRGIADWVIDEEKFGYDVKAFTIPIWGAGGELITVRYRRDDSVCTEGPKYWGSSGKNRVCIVNEKALSPELLKKFGGVVVLCMPSEEVLLAREGLKRVDCIEANDALFSFEGIWQEPDSIVSREYDGEIVRIRPVTVPISMRVTPEHRVLVVRGKRCVNPSWNLWCSPVCARRNAKGRCGLWVTCPDFERSEWIEAKDVREHDWLLCPIDERVLSRDELIDLGLDGLRKGAEISRDVICSADFWRLIGYWFGDGTEEGGGSVRICLSEGQDDWASDIRRIVKEELCRVVNVRDEKKQVLCLFCSRQLVRWLRKHFRRDGEKVLPNWITWLPLRLQREFVVGFWRGDGKYKASRNEASIASVSLSALLLLQRMLWRFGIVVSISRGRKGGIVMFRGKEYRSKDLWELVGAGDFCALLDVGRKPKRQSRTKVIRQGRLMWFPVAEVERQLYKGKVWNFVMRPFENYVGQGICLHNCEGELDCFRLWSENVPTVAVTNGAEAFDEGFLPLFDLAEKVVVAFDMDEAGQKASHRVARMFGQRSRIMMWDSELGKDLTELLQHVDVEFAKSLIAQAKKPGKVNAHWKGKLREGFWKGE